MSLGAGFWIDPETGKPQLHFSGLSMLEKCGQRFFYRYIENLRMAPGIAMIIGSASHKVIEKNLRNKLDTGELLPAEAVEDYAAAAAHEFLDEGVQLTEEDGTLEQAKGKAVDETIDFATTHHYEAAPGIEPVAVEEKWVIDTGADFPFDLAGTTDVREARDGKRILRDSKTTRKTPAKNAADVSEQLTLYSLADNVVSGEIPDEVHLDFVVKLKSETKYVKRSSTRTMEDLQMQIRRIDRAAEVIRKGAFMPTDPDNWWCSARWCGYFSICPYAKRPTSVSPGGIEV